ncbi:MAG: c-type cytochrome [Bacteroidota bacterium]
MGDHFRLIGLAYSLLILLISCELQKEDHNAGLALPEGFEAVVVIDSLKGKVREIAVNSNGDVYAKLRYSDQDGGCAVLRDEDGDGRADLVRTFGTYDHAGNWGYQTAMRIHQEYLYFSTELAVYRYKLSEKEMLPRGEAELIMLDDHAHGDHEHNGKPITFDKQGNMYVPFGAPSNACQDPKRTPFQPGLDPCPQLDDHAGIWRFDKDTPNQKQEDGMRYATGIRSVVAMDWNEVDDQLYVVMHGRDDLLRLFPTHFSPWKSAMLPAEEFLRVTEGANFGWPYCYYDQIQEKKVLAPEYGGDGDSIGRCEEYMLPEIGFPGHWAPNGLHFYSGDQFPSRYKQGAFIAFHGSTIRAPYPQSGYFVAFVPFKNGRATGEWEVFADGFAGVDTIVNVTDAIFRPMGITTGPDGSLYLSETEQGKIWRIQFTGNKEKFGTADLAIMETHKSLPHIKTPDITLDNLQKDAQSNGEEIYVTYCGMCHQENGKGAPGRFPPLDGTEWVTGDPQRLIRVLLDGLEGGIEVKGVGYNSLMPQHRFLSDQQIASVLTYIRQNFGNSATPIHSSEVAIERNKQAAETKQQ